MLKNIAKNQIFLGGSRWFTTKIKKSVLLQDVDKIPVVTYPRSSINDRRVYVWGLSETGALGIQRNLKKAKLAHTAIVQHPSRLSFAETLDVIDVACGYGFSAFAVSRKDDISLFGTGINTDTQIGFHKHGGETNRPMELLIYPAPIELPKSSTAKDDSEDANNKKIQIRKCAAGRAHLLAISEDNIVYSLGNNAYGQCGRTIVPNELYAGREYIHQIDSCNGKDTIVDIHCGQDHSLFLTNEGKVYSCGWGADGQTGLGHFRSTGELTQVMGDIGTEHIVKVAGTVDCVLALNDKGEVFGWGNAEYSQLQTQNEIQQICLPQYQVSTKKCGKIVDIAAGGSYCLVLNDQGDVFVWGYGILGLGPSVDHRTEPTVIPSTLFGRNEFNTESRVTSIYSGISHMMAVTNQNDLYAWGKNKFGCLGLGHEKDQFFPFKVSIAAKVLKVSCGVDHTIALCKGFI